MNNNGLYIAYLAGPMRGYPRFNFDAFHEAEENIRYFFGWNVQNPARVDEQEGFDPDADGATLTPTGVEAIFDRDVCLLKKSHGIVMLPKWEESIGAQAEHWIARWLQKEVHFYVDLVKKIKSNLFK